MKNVRYTSRITQFMFSSNNRNLVWGERYNAMEYKYTSLNDCNDTTPI